MNIVMTPEEKKVFEAMSEEEKLNFQLQMDKKLEKLSIKTAILTTLLIESIDDLSQFNMYRQTLKNKGNLFQKECEKYLDDWFKTKDLTEDETLRKSAADFIVHSSKAADLKLEEVLEILTQD